MPERSPRRVDMTGCENVDHIGAVRAAEAMAAANDLMVHRRIIDARSAAADARLLYGDDQDHPTWTEDEAIEILGEYLPSFRRAAAGREADR